MFTEEQEQEYIDNGGHYCPFCSSTNIEGGHPEQEGATSSCKITCYDCGAMWYDVYNLVGIQQISEPTRNENGDTCADCGHTDTEESCDGCRLQKYRKKLEEENDAGTKQVDGSPAQTP
jgi:hypothetical protein